MRYGAAEHIYTDETEAPAGRQEVGTMGRDDHEFEDELEDEEEELEDDEDLDEDDLDLDDEVALDEEGSVDVDADLGDLDVDEMDDDDEDDEDEEEDDDDDDEDDEDDDASLDQLLARRSVSRRGADDGDEDDILSLTSEADPVGKVAPLPTKVIPVKDRQEFVCSRCHLVKKRSQLADAERVLCRDCV